MTCPSLDQQQLAQTLVDAGADVVLSGTDAAAELAYWEGLRGCTGRAP